MWSIDVLAEEAEADRRLNIVKVTPGWGFLEQVMPVISELANQGCQTEIWVPEPWITHLVGARDPTGKELEKVGATFVAPNGLRGLSRSKSFSRFVLRNRITSVLLKVAGLLGLRDRLYPSESKYIHAAHPQTQIFADCYFYHTKAELSLGQRLLRDSDLDARHVSFYHGNFDPLSYPVPDNLPKQIDIHCYYEEQQKRLQRAADSDHRRVLLSTPPRLARQLEQEVGFSANSRTVWFFSRSTGLPSGVNPATKVLTLTWISRLAKDHDLDVRVQLHPAELKRDFLRHARLANLNSFSFGKLDFHDGRTAAKAMGLPLLAVSNFVGLIPNLVLAGIPCVEIWPVEFEDYGAQKGAHRFDFSSRGMSRPVTTFDELEQIVGELLRGQKTLHGEQIKAVTQTYGASGLSFREIISLVSVPN